MVRLMSTAKKLEVVLLPGLDGTGELLEDLRDRLSVHRPVRVIAYPKDRPLGYDQLTTLVEELVPDERFVLLGESFSGPIAIEIAARKKACVAGLVLASTFAKHSMPSLFAGLAKAFDHTWVPRFAVEAALLGTMGTPEVKATLARVLSEVPSNVIRLRAAEALRVDKRHVLQGVVCPTLCLTGRRDRLVGRNHAKELQSALPECEVRVFDAPHMLLQTHASEAAEAIDRFCERVAPTDYC